MKRYLATLPLLAFAAAVAAPARSADEDAVTVPLGLPAALLAEVIDTGRPEVELGRRLFFDPMLSRDRTVSCASCHVPETAFADTAARSEGVEGRLTRRNTPTLFNRALADVHMWNGEAESLEAQALLPIENPLEMDLALDEAVGRLASDEGYAASFQEVFGAPPSAELLGRAVASFVRTLVLGDSRVDRFRAGERNALTVEERGGLWIYESRGNCWKCHSGPNFSDETFHNTGVGAGADEPDPGRFEITGDEADRGAFKTPTLRGLTKTAPYMHDGSVATLREVVEFYRDGGHPNANLDVDMEPIELSDQDVDNLVAFLEALSE